MFAVEYPASAALSVIPSVCLLLPGLVFHSFFISGGNVFYGTEIQIDKAYEKDPDMKYAQLPSAVQVHFTCSCTLSCGV